MKVFILLMCLVALVATQDYKIIKKDFAVPLKSGPHDFEFANRTSLLKTIDPRVINGQQARDGQFPWAVRLSIGIQGGGGLLCTGSIISSTFILSARHCIAGVSASFIEASVGSADQQSSLMQRVYVNNVWYLTVTGGETPDIAIFRLSRALSFNDRIRPIRLAKRSQENDSFNGRTAVYSGWGGANNGLPRYLQYGSFTMRNNCGFRDFQLCSKGFGTTDVRGGDSGGPLIIYEDQPTQIGVAVFIVNGLAGSTKVAKFLQFINDITGIPIRN